MGRSVTHKWPFLVSGAAAEAIGLERLQEDAGDRLSAPSQGVPDRPGPAGHPDAVAMEPAHSAGVAASAGGSWTSRVRAACSRPW